MLVIGCNRAFNGNASLHLPSEVGYSFNAKRLPSRLKMISASDVNFYKRQFGYIERFQPIDNRCFAVGWVVDKFDLLTCTCKYHGCVATDKACYSCKDNVHVVHKKIVNIEYTQSAKTQYRARPSYIQTHTPRTTTLFFTSRDTSDTSELRDSISVLISSYSFSFLCKNRPVRNAFSAIPLGVSR